MPAARKLKIAPLDRQTEHALAIASWNMQRDHAWKQIVSDFEKLLRHFHRPDLFALQEAAQYVGRLRPVARDLGYGLTLAPKAKPGAALTNNALLYRLDSLRQTGASYNVAHHGKAHAYPDRLVVYGDYRWLAGDGSSLTVGSTQLNSHIEKGGHSRNLPRVALSKAHIAEFGQDMRKHARGYNLSFGAGDMNIDHDADERVSETGFPHAAFSKLGITSIYDELGTPASFDTHGGGRKIDEIYSVNADVRVRALAVHGTEGLPLATDHSPVCGVYAIRLRPKRKAA